MEPEKLITFLQQIIQMETSQLMLVITILFFITFLILMLTNNPVSKWFRDLFNKDNCGYTKEEIILLKNKIDEIERKLKEQERMKTSMSCVDKCLIQIQEIMISRYKKDKKSTDRDIRAYTKILDYTLNNTKQEKLIEYIRANHFSEKSTSEFTLYKTDTTKTLQSYHIMLLDREYYSDDFTISRKELFKLNEPIMNVIRDEIYKLFDNLLEISKDYE